MEFYDYSFNMTIDFKGQSHTFEVRPFLGKNPLLCSFPGCDVGHPVFFITIKPGRGIMACFEHFLPVVMGYITEVQSAAAEDNG